MKICELGGEGLVFPATDAEHDWPTVARAIAYGAGLLYSFMGVAVAADIFMASIEEVTSRKASKVLAGNRRKTVRVWNATVATLTLMALGSSAPEIFLSVIDIIKKEFHFGDLGPSTIVGSAAFNLLMIVAVCIVVIPQGEVRIIKNLPAFYITALFSMAAYVWMAFILLYSSEGIVDVWEAVVTLLLFVLLVYSSYKVDRGDVDGLLRLMRVVSAEDEAIAAKPSGANIDWKRRPISMGALPTQLAPASEKEEYTVVWHHRVEGWQAQTTESREEAERRYAALPVSVTRSMFGADGVAVKTWYLSRRWGRHLKTFYMSLKGGSYLKFPAEEQALAASEEEASYEIQINRTGDLNGEVTCSFHTESMTAVPGYDYEAIEGQLEFAPGEAHKILTLKIFGRPAWRCESMFLLILEELEGNATFDPTDDGGSTRAILTVKLSPSPGHAGNRSMRKAMDGVFGVYGVKLGFADWKEQLTTWIWVNGSPEEQAEASKSDWFFHIVGLPWKLMSAFMPPTSFFGGWVAFYASLLLIGCLTAIVSDMAELLGCVVGVPDIVTAISFVALGTSMPDLFASLTAAKEDPTADASVVNVTGSNSVNVFLGLGGPWSIAAIYWQVTGRTADWAARYPEEAAAISGAAFVVKSKNMGYSVLLFCGMCTFAIALLHLRRRWLGAELGGPLAPKYAIGFTFVLYWVLWVALVSWRVLRWELSLSPVNLTEIAGAQVWLEGIVVHTFGAALFLCCTVITIVLTRRHKKAARRLSTEHKDDNSSEFASDHSEKESEGGHRSIGQNHNDVSCESFGSGVSELDKVFSNFLHFRC
mmetsp:Transcript_87804/g.253560  ORF Transcript_87804/g.253560 Transcript_87804/m.253560 type:complete len:818 (-) Transcript_87804:94-2547(-)